MSDSLKKKKKNVHHLTENKCIGYSIITFILRKIVNNVKLKVPR